MKLQLTLGSDTPRSGLLVPVLKLVLVGLVAMLVLNRKDIRRYLRLRRM
jgi:hypothetical protein